MYQILNDGKILHDTRVEELTVLNPKCSIEVNSVDTLSFDVVNAHPLYNEIVKMKSIVELVQNDYTIFRGRIVNEKIDFNNTKSYEIESVLGFLNDSIVRPFNFPEDFEISDGENVVEFFLEWILENHNSQVQDFQKFKLGTVTVTDPNNYITRSSIDYNSSFSIIKDKLFNSSLGGYIVVRYEEDGNYIDYLEEFTTTNSQKLEVGENILDLNEENDFSQTYTAIIPLGYTYKDIEDKEVKLTIESLPDGAINDDIVKQGDTIYSISGVEKYGFIYAPTSDTTWEDVTIVDNLLSKAVAYLQGESLSLSNTIEVSAVDLHFSDNQIESLKPNQKIIVTSSVHGLEAVYPLESLEIDINNPQNTKIKLGKTQRTLLEREKNINDKIVSLDSSIETVKKGINSYSNVDTSNKTIEFLPAWQVIIKNKILSFDTIYPVGSVYISVNEVDPGNLFGGLWEKIQGKFLLGSSDSYPLGDFGGEESHELTIEELPSHCHTPLDEDYGFLTYKLENSIDQIKVAESEESNARYTQVGVEEATSESDSGLSCSSSTSSIGGGLAHNNMPPYLSVNIWQRIE